MGNSKSKLDTGWMGAVAVALSIIVLVWYANYQMNHTEDAVQKFPAGYEIALWEWRSPTAFNEVSRRELFDVMEEHGLNMVYLNIEEYINIMEGSPERVEEDIMDFVSALTLFIREARARGIGVEALAGSPDWVLSSHSYIPVALLDFVLRYNQTSEYKLVGVHFDIEYYNLSDYRSEMESYATSFLRLAEDLVDTVRAGDGGERIGFAVSYWLASETSLSPEISYDGEEKVSGLHLLDVLNTYSNSYVAIMAYRNHHDGRGGTIAITEDNLNYLEENNYLVRAIIGQETTDVEPDRVTHYGLGLEHLKYSVAEIVEAYKEHRAFAGVAIHDSRGFLKIVE